MFNSIRPAFKQATRATRTFSNQSAGKSSAVRNTALGASALLAVTYALSQKQVVRMDDRVPRESVLDSHSLKESLHKRPAGEKKPAPEKKEATPSLVQEKLDEAEADKGPQGAFNEETGEINWDCPCLGGMADGPCGEQFKAAFSCFVYSEAEPKGMDCVEKFKGMQDCFREHPEIYGEEIDDDEESNEAHSSFTHDHPVPKAPTDTPPENNKAVGVVPREFPTKGETKIKPSYH